MKISKSISILAILIAGLTIPTMQSCKKYPEGPSISLQSRTERVTNTWRVDNYKINGNDHTSAMSDYSETYSENGDYTYSWGMFSGTGVWKFENDDKEIKLIGTSNQNNYLMTILKLEEKEFWYYYMDGDDKKEFHMIQK